MFSEQLVEWIGYLAYILIVISLMMTNILRLRIINTIGCVTFVVYGLLVGAYPVALSNFAIILINMYNLYKLKNQN